ncbi:Uncharacterised protein [uncultured archaeon]|nr:Uncharacterised protein [uncultured archaeon]
MEAESLAAVRSRYGNWASISSADGDYRNFAKFEFERVEKEGMGKIEFEILGTEKKEKEKGKSKSSRLSLARLGEISTAFLSPFLLQAPGLPPQKEQDKLLAWHGAHVQDGWVLRVPENTDAGFVHLRTRAAGHSALHHLIILEKGASAEVMIECEGKNTTYINLHTDITESILGPDARLTLTTVQRYPQKDWSFSHHDQRLDKFSKLTHTAAAFGAAVSRTRTLNRLAGDHSQAHAYQLFIANGEQFMDMETASQHEVPDTQGEMTCRGALDGKSLGVYRGRIRIERAAPNTISHQSGSALLLSEDSAANIIPSLQVDNDQVEAGHGATVGGLDEKELFYLRSRGLDEEKSRRLVMEGYYLALIAKIPGEKTQEGLRALVRQHLPAYHPSVKHRQKLTVVANPGLEARPAAHEGIRDAELKKNEGKSTRR